VTRTPCITSPVAEKKQHRLLTIIYNVDTLYLHTACCLSACLRAFPGAHLDTSLVTIFLCNGVMPACSLRTPTCNFLTLQGRADEAGEQAQHTRGMVSDSACAAFLLTLQRCLESGRTACTWAQLLVTASSILLLRYMCSRDWSHETSCMWPGMVSNHVRTDSKYAPLTMHRCAAGTRSSEEQAQTCVDFLYSDSFNHLP
jgi:hypothetical protein